MTTRAGKMMLQGSPLFRGLPPATLERIAALATQKSYRRGEIVFSAGDAGDALFGVVSGRIRISAGNADGREIFLNIMEPGDSFGEIALLDGGTRTATATAIDPPNWSRSGASRSSSCSSGSRKRRSNFCGYAASGCAGPAACSRTRRSSTRRRDSPSGCCRSASCTPRIRPAGAWCGSRRRSLRTSSASRASPSTNNSRSGRRRAGSPWPRHRGCAMPRRSGRRFPSMRLPGALSLVAGASCSPATFTMRYTMAAPMPAPRNNAAKGSKE